MSHSALRRRSATEIQAAAESLKKAADGNSSGGYAKDERFWMPETDQAGNASAVIRFLPNAKDGELPFVKEYKYAFKGPTGKWFIELAPSAIGLPDPVMEANSALWNSGIDSDKEVARKRKRNMKYISNILVVKDPKHPENEGKVFLYRYGKKLMDKLIAIQTPDADLGEEPRQPWDFFDGAVLKLKVRKVDGQVNYDMSTVEPAPDLYGGDEEKLAALLDKLVDLSEFTDPKLFKSYEELKTKFEATIGISSGSTRPAQKPDFDEDDVPFDTGTEKSTQSSEKPAAPAKSADDEDMEFFNSLGE